MNNADARILPLKKLQCPPYSFECVVLFAQIQKATQSALHMQDGPNTSTLLRMHKKGPPTLYSQRLRDISLFQKLKNHARGE